MARSTDKRWKGILIDWNEIADMDAEDYELKPLNQQQVAILLALLEYQKWPTRWTNLGLNKSELETYIADIEQRLMRNESGGFDMTEEEMKRAIRDGIYEASNNLAKQIVSGRYINISVDEDGNVSDPTTEGDDAGLPPDDPDTPNIDETLASKMGAASAVARAYESLLDRLDTYYGTVNGTPVSAASTAKYGIKLYFPCDELVMDSAIDNYYSYRSTNPRIQFNTSIGFEGYLFCRGISERSIRKWLVDQSGFAEQKMQICDGLLLGLAEEFFTDYYNAGSQVPSLDYLDASCIPIETEVKQYSISENSLLVLTWKANHRMKITVTGLVHDTAAGKIGDQSSLWWKTTAAGVKTFRSGFVSIAIGGLGATNPTSNEVPYNATGTHVWTMDTFAGGQARFTLTSDLTTPNAAEKFTLTIEDLGEIAV